MHCSTLCNSLLITPAHWEYERKKQFDWYEDKSVSELKFSFRFPQLVSAAWEKKAVMWVKTLKNHLVQKLPLLVFKWQNTSIILCVFEMLLYYRTMSLNTYFSFSSRKMGRLRSSELKQEIRVCNQRNVCETEQQMLKEFRILSDK